MRYFEDCVIGETIHALETYQVTEAEIIEMARKWDPQYFHTDPLAAKDSIFGGLVAATAHVFAISSWFGQKFGEQSLAAVSALGFNNMQWHAPVRPGDELSCLTLSTAKRLSHSRPGIGILESKNEIRNQDEELVFSYDNATLVQCRHT